MISMLKCSDCPQNILIIGAGGGQELLTLGKLYPYATYTAVDTSMPMLRLAQQQIAQLAQQLNIEWHNGELSSLKANKSFDIVTCHLVLHFLKEMNEKKQLLQHIAHSLKAGGTCFISSINANITGPTFSQQLRLWQESMRHNNLSVDDLNHFEQSFGSTTHPIPLDKLIALLRETGFQTIIPYFKSHMIDALVAIK
nr:class I SAM-dependent methyltransferase [Bacillus pakistanensis]